MTLRLLLLPFFVLGALAIAACASGSSVVSGTTRAPIEPELVQIYLEPPKYFEVIGLISASSDAGLTEQASMNFALDELKKQAAKLGANGALVISTTNSAQDIVGGYAKSIQGKAILITPK